MIKTSDIIAPVRTKIRTYRKVGTATLQHANMERTMDETIFNKTPICNKTYAKTNNKSFTIFQSLHFSQCRG